MTRSLLLILITLSSLGKKARRLIHQNLFWAFRYNAVGILLAIFGIFSPIYAAFAMVMSSVIVIVNSQRI